MCSTAAGALRQAASTAATSAKTPAQIRSERWSEGSGSGAVRTAASMTAPAPNSSAPARRRRARARGPASGAIPPSGSEMPDIFTTGASAQRPLGCSVEGVLKVSVIVPVYNPGHNIDDCISSLLGQSLPPDEYEVIFVDDGSSDGTETRLDALAAEHEHVRVEHIPNSGWPGRPRNIGIEMARGEYVYFVDNDDWIGTDALKRLYGRAQRDEADIVIGRVVGEGKFVARTIFKRDRKDVTLEWPPLLRLLTPHKLFRKAMLDEHAIRFPEGRRRLEDHVLTMHAYFHAQHISVLARYPCYHWVLRDDGENASTGEFDAAGYYGNEREVLDLVDEHM